MATAAQYVLLIYVSCVLRLSRPKPIACKTCNIGAI